MTACARREKVRHEGREPRVGDENASTAYQVEHTHTYVRTHPPTLARVTAGADSRVNISLVRQN